jgi:hypothetical protein
MIRTADFGTLGRVDSYSERDQGRSKVDESQEGFGVFLVASGYASVMFESADEAFDEISSFVFSFVVASSNPTHFEGRNHDFGLAFTNQIDKRIGVVGSIGDHRLGAMLAQQVFGPRQVVFLAGAEPDFDDLPAGIASEVEFAAVAAPRTTESLVLFF